MRMRCRTGVMSYRLARSLLGDLRNKHANLRGLLEDLRDKYANLCDSYANLRSTSTNLCDSHSNLRSVPANLRTGVLKSAGCQRPCWRTEHWNIKETTMPIWQTVARAT